MKILLLLPSLEAGGAEKVAIALVNALAIKHEVTLFVLLERGSLASSISPKVSIVYGAKRGNTVLRKLRILSRLILAAQRHAVIIAGLEITATYFAYAASIATRKPLIAWVHTLLFEYFTLPYFHHYHKLICRWLYRRIKYQVFVSEGAKNSMLKLVRTQLDIKQAVIYNPLSDCKVQPTPLCHLPHAQFILAVGRLAPEKGFDLLIEAFSQLRKMGEKVELLILGEGLMRAQLEAQIHRLDLVTSVHLPGFVDNASAYYPHAAVFALSSKIEGWSMALVEAMQSGIPIVTMDLPSVHELLGSKADPVAQGDVLGFAQKLQAALHTEEPLMHKYLRQKKVENFTISAAVQAWEAILTTAIAKRIIH